MPATRVAGIDVDPRYCLRGARAALATMHGKQQAIAPVLSRLGLAVEVPAGLDTDRFGTFSREAPRSGSALDAARAKISAALALAPGARIGIASEGSFGPHPWVPFAPAAEELVVLVDADSGVEVLGRDIGVETNFAHEQTDDPAAARRFAQRIGFPSHGVIVMGCVDGRPDPAMALEKNAADPDALDAAVRATVAACGRAHLETDMRAHRNPTRMRAIERAARDLVQSWNARCSECGRPGFVVAEWVPGLPCGLCTAPTEEWRAQIRACHGCGARAESPRARRFADPSRCGSCNP